VRLESHLSCASRSGDLERLARSFSEEVAQVVTYANAVAALQVTRQGAAAAVPRRSEVELFVLGVG
jgi:sugar/nucleoside kinase (ribokinase family)